VSDLNTLPAKSEVDVATLVKRGLINAQEAEKGVKILGDGELTVALTINIPVSEAARVKIEKAGGQVKPQQTRLERGGSYRTTGTGVS
jgi:ribosomal protein L15